MYLRFLYLHRRLEISVEILIERSEICVSGVNYESSVDGIGEREWNGVVKFIVSRLPFSLPFFPSKRNLHLNYIFDTDSIFLNLFGC